MLNPDAQRLKAYFEKLAWHEETIRPRDLKDPVVADMLDRFMITLTDTVDQLAMQLMHLPPTGAVGVPPTNAEARTK